MRVSRQQYHPAQPEPLDDTLGVLPPELELDLLEPELDLPDDEPELELDLPDDDEFEELELDPQQMQLG